MDISELKALCPDATWKLLYKRPEDELPYAAETTVDGNELTWHISSVDVAQTGRGSAQVLGVKSDSRTGADQVVVKGPVHTVRIEQSLIGETENPVHVWLELAQEAAQRAEGAALDARLSADTVSNMAGASLHVCSNTGSGTRYSFLHCPGLPKLDSSCTVTKAYLQLYLRDAAADRHYIGVREVTGEWDSSTITYNNMPGVGDRVANTLSAPFAPHSTASGLRPS